MKQGGVSEMQEIAAAWLVRLRGECVTGEDRRAFQAWLSEDPAHAIAYARLDLVWDLSAQVSTRNAARRSDAGERSE